MEFLLLGPLEARSDREILPLGGPRQRAVLADLLLHAGSVVSMDLLIDDLWGLERPATAEAVVQNAVSRLRKTLGKDVIETRAPGYVLRVDVGAIDARRFERLVQDARPLPPRERVAALRDALGLWRGPAFADLSFESFLQDEIARLDELRLSALEDRLEADVELRNHDAVIGEAAALAAQHPARERLCRLLMLALHRAGRQQDALDVYGTTRRALDELWGLEPSAETRALQLMILTQDPAIAPMVEAPAVIGVVRRPVALLLVELLLDEALELEAAGSALVEARRALDGVVARHGGSLSPDFGVEMVAAFGAEGAREDDVLRAARAAVELREILSGWETDVRLAVGTGRLLVDEGHPVLVGPVVGETRRALHDAASGEIVATPAAARLGGEALELNRQGRVVGVHAGRQRLRVETSPFVGRATELDELRAAFRTVASSASPQNVVVLGEAGIGKSRLVAEAFGDLRGVVLEAACVPYGEATTFRPLRELAVRAAALDVDAPDLGDLPTADAAFAAARALLEHFTASGPVVVVLDDLHWAVPTFLDLVEYLVRAVAGPLLVVSLSRPELLEQRPELGRGAIVLGTLPRDETRRLVAALSGPSAMDPKVADAILDASDGVPLFVEQLISFASETDLAATEIPPTLDALLVGRLDRLEPGERRVLERAAVIGRVFSREELDAITSPAEQRELAGRMRSLDRRRLIRAGDLRSEFVHALVRDAAYSGIGRDARSELHESLAAWLKTRRAEDELIGTHLERAALNAPVGPRRRAIATDAFRYLTSAAGRAVQRLEFAAARNLLDRGLTLADERGEVVIEAECLLGRALKDLGELELALATLDRAEIDAEALGATRLVHLSRIEQVWPRLASGELPVPAAESVLEDAELSFKEARDEIGRARALRIHAGVLSEAGTRCDDTYRLAGEAESIYRRSGVEADVDVLLVSAATDGSMPLPDVRRVCEERLARTKGSPRLHAYLAFQHAYLVAALGEFAVARTLASDARAQLRTMGDDFGLATAGTLLPAIVELLAGEWDAARDLLEPAIGGLRTTDSSFLGPFLARLARARLGCAEPAIALGLAHEARAALSPHDVRALALADQVAGRALAAMGRANEGVQRARSAVEALEQTDALIETGECLLDYAQVLAESGEDVEARLAASAGVDCLDRKRATRLAERGRVRHARLLGGGEVGRPPRRSRP